MKILVLTNLYPPDTVGGYEMGCRQAVDALRARGHDVRVLTTAPRTPVASPPHVHRKLRLTDMWDPYFLSRVTPIGFRQIESHANRIDSFNVHALLGELDDFRPDVVYNWMLIGVGGLGLVACLEHLRVPWVWHLMDDVPRALCMVDNGLSPALVRAFNRGTRGIYLSCSRQLADHIESQGIALNGAVEVLPNWIAGPCPPVRSEFYKGGTLRVVAAAASITQHYDKGMDLLIRTAAELRARGLDQFTLDLYGKVTESYFGDLIRSLKLQEHVRLRGNLAQSELMAAYRDYDVFAFPARHREPFGFAPLEASPSGCVPVMATISGIAEWFVHGVHCLKVPRTAVGFADALAAILDGRVDLEPIGRRMAAVSRRDFHLDQLVVRIEDALERAARRPRTGAGTASEAYRLALLAEKVSAILIQESDSVPPPRAADPAPTAPERVPAEAASPSPLPRERILAVNAPESAQAIGPASKFVRAARSLGRRLVRRLLRPVLAPQEELLRQVVARLDRVEHLTQSAHVKGDGAHEKGDAAHAKGDATGRQVELLTRRQDEVTAEVQTALAFGWDYVALVRRLAVLEDQVAALGGPAELPADEDPSALQFPGLHTHAPLQVKNA